MMRRFLPSVIANSGDAEIVVADNGSTDDSLTMLASEFPSVRRVAFSENHGFAEGYNRAIDAVEAEYVVLLNSDVEVSEAWLDTLVGFMESHSDVAACQPKLLSYSQRDSFEYAGAAGGFLDKYGYPFCRGRIFDSVERDEGQYDAVSDIFWATGACLMIRRDDYIRAGGLDKRFFAHNEEIDLCWRIHLLGRRIVCVPQSKVWHVGGGTLPQGNPRKTFLNFRNNLLMLYKNLPERQLRSVMRMRLLLDYVALLQYVAKGAFGDARAVWRARREYSFMRHEYYAERQHIQQTAVSHTVPGHLSLSILWQYHVRRHRKFSQIK